MPSSRHRARRIFGLAVLAATLVASEAPAACAMTDCPMMGSPTAAGRSVAATPHCRPDRLAAADCCVFDAPAGVATSVLAAAAPTPAPRVAAGVVPAPVPVVARSQPVPRRPAPPGSSPPSGRDRLALLRTLLI